MTERSACMRALLLAVLLALGACGLHAQEAAPADPELERRVLALSEQLRCLVCQNQTLADSHAELAIDLKNQVREKLAGGMAERDVIGYMVERYGDFVLYRPPVKGSTWVLWFGPFLLLAAAIGLLLRRLAKRRAMADEALPQHEMRRAAGLLHGADDLAAKEKP